MRICAHFLWDGKVTQCPQRYTLISLVKKIRHEDTKGETPLSLSNLQTLNYLGVISSANIWPFL